MKQFIKDYLRIIAGAIIGFVFVISSFYLVINYYHSDELKTQIYVSEKDTKVVKYNETMNKIKTSLNSFDRKKNSNYEEIYQNLSTCYLIMTGKDMFYSAEINRYYSPYDIYVLGGNFQSQVLNNCWALHLSNISNSNNSDKIKLIAPFVKNQVEIITKDTTFALDEIKNNSSYFYTTNVTSSTIRNYLHSDYEMVVDSYQEFADLVLNLSNYINGGEFND